MVGAGSLVTKDIPNNTLWYGNPAKFKAYICNCGEKLDTVLQCPTCKKRYELVNGLITEL
ncbi:dTDP-3-amino-3,6-dideoxy-alpha-D-galactopyranose 3-N-acetyltransferase [compost metagenome]